MEHPNLSTSLARAHAHSQVLLRTPPSNILPDPAAIAQAESSLASQLPEHAQSLDQTTTHLLTSIAPALNASSLSPNYYGFVTGGVTPAARVADSLVSLYDQNALVHLPDQTVASTVEDRALRLLMQLLKFEPTDWSGTFTTGATASNVLGLALGRESVINAAVKSRGGGKTVGEDGLLKACRAAGIEDINIYTTKAHSSLGKAASLVGIGRGNVRDVGTGVGGLSFDFRKLEMVLKQGRQAAIVAVSCGEVNTGLFATDGRPTMGRLRALCDKYHAWLHVDGAFGIFARILPVNFEFSRLCLGGDGLELADSIAGDGHKMLNVPYDCGFFFCKPAGLAQQVFQNANAAYLNTASAATDKVQSPLNIGIENSRRFRGLSVYATLITYGREGYQDMLMRQIRFARAVASYLFQNPAFELLPKRIKQHEDRFELYTFIIVLFRAQDRALNESLVRRINATSLMYVSGTVWDGEPASRIAVSNWQVDPERDLEVVKGVLESVLDCHLKESKRA